MKTLLFTAAAIVAFAAPALASAQDAAPAGPTMSVRHADLNLDETRDAKVMLHRIRKAAVDVCNSGGGGYEALAQFETCYRDMTQRAVTQLAAPRVSAAFQAKDKVRVLARQP